MTERQARRYVTGVVVSDRMDKTITVRVDRLVRHPMYRKFVSRSSKYYAHDEKEDAGVGDTVEIAETRPLSKLKRWTLVRVLSRAAGAVSELQAPQVGERT